jgi:hypothetical protein
MRRLAAALVVLQAVDEASAVIKATEIMISRD